MFRRVMTFKYKIMDIHEDTAQDLDSLLNIIER